MCAGCRDVYRVIHTHTIAYSLPLNSDGDLSRNWVLRPINSSCSHDDCAFRLACPTARCVRVCVWWCVMVCALRLGCRYNPSDKYYYVFGGGNGSPSHPSMHLLA